MTDLAAENKALRDVLAQVADCADATSCPTCRQQILDLLDQHPPTAPAPALLPGQTDLLTLLDTGDAA